MRRVRRARRVVAVLACVACMLVAPPRARADQGIPVEKQGWWTATSAPAPALVPVRGAAAGAPDVASGELYVAGSANQVIAVAALRYVIPAGAAVDTLTLTIAPGTLTLPATKLRACPLTGTRDFSPAEGGPASDAPSWDCEHASPGELDPAGVAYRFSIPALVEDGVLAVAIVPAGDADRVVLAGPDPTALTWGTADAGIQPALPGTTGIHPPGAATGSITVPARTSRPTGTAPPGAAATNTSNATPAGSVRAGPAGLTGRGHAPPGAVLGALAVVVLAIGVWWRGRQTLAEITLRPRNSVS